MNYLNQNQIDNEIPISTMVEVGRLLQQVDNLIRTDIGWEPQRQLLKLWQPRLERMQRDWEQLLLIEEPVLIIAVTGGVKSGKTHIANMILEHPLLKESLRHETRQAWAVIPPGVTESAVLKLMAPTEPDWIRFVKFGARIKSRNLIIVDLPDFDAESELTEFRQNQKIAESVLEIADVIVFVSSQAHNLTRRTFNWLNQFRQGHGFIFVYNEVSGNEGIESKARMDQLRDQVVQAGFSQQVNVIGVPYDPNNYNGQMFIETMMALPANKTLRCWRVAEQIRQLTHAIQTIYRQHQAKIQQTRQTVDTLIAQPLKKTLRQDIKTEIQTTQGALRREMLFRLSGRIGGIFGGFLTLRKLLSYWSLPGIWLGTRLLGGQTGAAVATGSIVFGALTRSYEAWRDRRNLKTQTFQTQIEHQQETLQQQLRNIHLELELLGLAPLTSQSEPTAKPNQEKIRARISEQMEAVFNLEMNKNTASSRMTSFLHSRFGRILWNLLPSAILIFAFFNIAMSFLNDMPFFPDAWSGPAIPTGFSFYLNILGLLGGVCYLQYLFLSGLLHGTARRIGTRLFEAMAELEHPFLIELKQRLDVPQQWAKQAERLNQNLEMIHQELRNAIKGVDVV